MSPEPLSKSKLRSNATNSTVYMVCWDLGPMSSQLGFFQICYTSVGWNGLHVKRGLAQWRFERISASVHMNSLPSYLALRPWLLLSWKR